MFGIILLGIVLVASLLLGLAVYLNNTQARLNQFFGALSASLAVWSVILFAEDVGNPSLLQGLVRLDFFLAAIMVGLFYGFCRALVRTKFRLLDLTLIGITIVAAVLAALGLLAVPKVVGANLVLQPQPAYPIFIGQMLTGVLGGMYLLWWGHRRATGRQKFQLEIIGTGLFLTIVVLVITTIILPQVFNISDADIARASVLGVLLFIGSSAYAIIRHRFLDLRLFVARSVAYLLSLVAFSVIYGGGLFLASSFIFPGQEVGNAQLAYYALTALVLAVSFQWLKRFFEHITNRLFFRDRYDSQELISQVGSILISEFKLDVILRQTLAKICQDLHILSGQYVIFSGEYIYKLEHYGRLPLEMLTAKDLRHLTRSVTAIDELEGGTAKAVMEHHGMRLAVRMHTNDKFVGYILLGDKLSGDIYSRQDIEVLKILAQELAVAIVNAKAYEEIANFNTTLTVKVELATRRLQVANRHLRELDTAKDEFISMASHQLRTPLTTIKGYISMLMEGDAGQMSREQKEFLKYAYGGSQRMVNLINDLLNVSRMQAGKFMITKAPTDLVRVVREEVEQLQSHAQAKKLQLNLVLSRANLSEVSLDEGKTRQVIMNFIDNAIYYTQQGTITVTLGREGSYARLEVKDSGIGVPIAAQKNLFGKFFRAPNAMNLRPDGTGLGLYLAKRVIEDQGGTIIFKSIEGAGSTFGFKLPVK